MKYDFSGWATRANLLCADGRTIMPDAFKDCDGQKVPLVWNHEHNKVDNVLGHALLENRPEGVYAYGVFNDTQAGKDAKCLVEHGDIGSLSIYANKLQQSGGNVHHGVIREVSLVMAGANPGAFIDTICMAHSGEIIEDEAIIKFHEPLSLYHADKSDEETDSKEGEKDMPDTGNDKTVKEVFDTFTEDQKTVVYALVEAAVEENQAKHSDDLENEGDDAMKHNIFDAETNKNDDVLTHAEMEAIFTDAKRGSLKDAVLAHGIEDIEYLFPDAKNVTNVPGFIQRDMGWVSEVMNGTHHTPFSRIKSTFADITEDEARAKGYIKGKKKIEEVFSLLKRTTDPQTIYKKQKLDRDDVIDITDFDVVAWIKSEMRMMLDEEIARAVLVGDGRLKSADDHISEDHIRPIWTDDDLYTINRTITENSDADVVAKSFIREAIKSRKEYKGSGSPVLFTGEDMLADCLLLEDKNGRIIYESEAQLATALRVRKIVSVPVMDGLKRDVDGTNHNLVGIIVNLNDYNIGADKGGAVNMFDDFDIDYNAQKYLIETRISGALIRPKSAIVIETVPASDAAA